MKKLLYLIFIYLLFSCNSFFNQKEIKITDKYYLSWVGNPLKQDLIKKLDSNLIFQKESCIIMEYVYEVALTDNYIFAKHKFLNYDDNDNISVDNEVNYYSINLKNDKLLAFENEKAFNDFLKQNNITKIDFNIK